MRFRCVLLLVVALLCESAFGGTLNFVTFMVPPSGTISVANITANFTHSIATALTTNDYRVVLASTQFWSLDLNNRSIFYTVINFVDPTAADVALNAPTSLQLLVAFNAILVAGTNSARFVTYIQQWGLFNYYAPGLTTTAAPPTTPAPTNATTPAPPTYTPVPTAATPNATVASVGDNSQDNSVVLAVVFGILGCVVLVGGAIFVVKKFILVKKKAKSSGGGYAKRGAQM